MNRQYGRFYPFFNLAHLCTAIPAVLAVKEYEDGARTERTQERDAEGDL